MALGKKLLLLRKKAKKSLKEVGEDLNITSVYISDLEKEKRKNPSVDVLKKIAKYYSVSIDYLLSEENETVENDENQPHTIAAHLDGEELSGEEIEDLKKYIDFLLSKRKK